MVYIFDVDGTLTPPSAKIDPKFEDFFMNWVATRKFYIVSGNDYKKIDYQLGKTICYLASVVFACSGLIHYKNCRKVWEVKHTFPVELYTYLQKYLKESAYPDRFGTHIEKRGPLINFSVVGRDCTREYRKDYYLWDASNNERKVLLEYLENNFDVSVSIGGEISIDILPRGWGKHKILDSIDDEHISFYGDKTEKGQNDYSIFQSLLEKGQGVFKVQDYKHTMELLR